MTYREAVKAAIAAWRGIWLHWNKSTESQNAVTFLERVMGDDTGYDDKLEELVSWLIGASDEPFHYVMAVAQLKEKSALYKKLVEEVEKADPPVHKPVAPAPVVKKRRKPKRPKSAKSDLPRSVLAWHQEFWKDIEITNKPTSQPGKYIYTEQDKHATNISGSAQAVGKDVKEPMFWITLGRMTMEHKIGRCLHCAGAVVNTLVQRPELDAYVIAVQGNVTYDHHYVIIGTLAEIKLEKGYVIDVWDANLNKKSPIQEREEYTYLRGEHKLFCLFDPLDRAAHRGMATK
jgi:hypothetical protein